MKKKMTMILAACLAAALMTGCGAASNDSAAMSESYSYSTNTDMTYDSTMGWEAGGAELPEETAAAEDTSVVISDRKLIRNVDMEVETKEYDKLLTELDAQIQKLGGYIENMDSYNGSRYSDYRSARHVNMTIRIPQAKLESFLNEVSDICNVVRRSDSVDDVTLQYVDLESHKEALRTEHDRLLELLERAESLEDILVIEERLTSVRYRMESMESQLRTMDNQVSYSTIYLNISEVQELTYIEEVEETPWQRISEGFMHSLRGVGHFFAEFGIWILVHIPQLIIWALVITGIVLLIKHGKKKRAAKLAAAKQEAARQEAARRAAMEAQAQTPEK